MPYYLRLKDGAPIVFAGLWESWNAPDGEVVESCTILTTLANPVIELVHERMPVILHPRDYGVWLDPNITEASALVHLFQPYPAELMVVRRVSLQVNSHKNDSPQLLDPL